MHLAIYGKGGIGKSTVSANLSAALALCGSRVLQIGCDPKHDSTRLLHHGRKVRTVLDYLLNTPEDEQRLSDVLMPGFAGTGCVEAGGPRPGMGCAGRGILTAFDFLRRFDAFSGYDTVVYDVLGDVVCGGFAVPVRRQYADAVFLVTSGEAMALYAANNILQGIRNLNPQERRIAGIIYNSRGDGDEKERVEQFAEAVGLPICLSIPRSSVFSRAERAARTVVELDGSLPEAQLFLSLAREIRAGLVLYEAKPLDEERMEGFLQGRPDRPAADASPLPSELKSAQPLTRSEAPAPKPAGKRALSDPFSRVPLFGCAYRGAVDLAVHIKDAAVLGHAPTSCTYYAVNGITSYSRRGLFERGVLYPAFIPQHFENTDITVQDAVFGGVEHAREKALSLVKQGVRCIIAVTACIPGLSGDDLNPVKEELAAMGCEMYIVHTDGVSAGDYNQGMAECYKTLAREAVRPGVQQDPDSINLVYELTWSASADENFNRIREILDALGIRVNCRFLCATTADDVRGFLRAPYSVMARDDALGRELKGIFVEKYGCRFLDGTLPRGFRESARWTETLGRLYGREREAAALIAGSEKKYRTRLERLKAVFRGKRTVIFLTGDGHDWLLDLAEDLELEVEKLILLGRKGFGNEGWNRRFSADWEFDRRELRSTVEAIRPELLLTGDPSALADPPEYLSVIPVPRDVGTGFFSGLDAAGRWVKLMDRVPEGRWKRDRQIFEKYYA